MDTCSGPGRKQPHHPATPAPVESRRLPSASPTSTRPPLTCSPTPRFKRRLPLSLPAIMPRYLRPSQADGARGGSARAGRTRGPRGCGGAGERDCARDRPQAGRPNECAGEPRGGRRGRVRGAGVRARVCARPRRSAGRAGGASAALLRDTAPPRVPPHPASRLSSRRASASSAAAAPGPAAHTACGRAGDAGRPAPAPVPAPAPAGEAEPLPPDGEPRRVAFQPAPAAAAAAAARRPGAERHQVSAAPTPAPSPARPGVRRWVPGGESCAGSRGLPEPGPRLQQRAAASRRVRASVPGSRRPTSAGRVQSSAPLPAARRWHHQARGEYFRSPPPLSESVTRVFGAAR